jgi:hypothetical protein
MQVVEVGDGGGAPAGAAGRSWGRPVEVGVNIGGPEAKPVADADASELLLADELVDSPPGYSERFGDAIDRE